MCDTVVRVTDDGFIFAKNSDRDPGEAQGIEWHPSADHGGGEMLACTWIEIPQVAHTHAIAISRPWWMWGAEMGANEFGLTIGNEAVFTRSRITGRALLGMDLVRLALERARTADEAVAVIVGLLEIVGQGGPCSAVHPAFQYHNSFLIVDRARGFVLETAGSQWAVEEITGPVRAISNGLTIPGFAEAHADRVRGAIACCDIRRSRVEELALRVHDVSGMFAVLRDHGDGRRVPHYQVLNGAMSGPCVHPGGLVASSQTAGSWVADLRGDPVHWVTATAAPCTSLFFPLRVDQPAALGCAPGGRRDDSMWWSHEPLREAIMRDPMLGYAAIADERDGLEAEWTFAAPATEEVLGQVDLARSHWLGKVAALDLVDRRPSWVRRTQAAPDAEAVAGSR